MTDGGNCSQPHRRRRRTCLKNWFWRSSQPILIEPRTYAAPYYRCSQRPPHPRVCLWAIPFSLSGRQR